MAAVARTRRPVPTPRRRQKVDRGRLLALALAALVRLRAGRWTVDALADALGVSRRTVYRVLTALRAAGLPLERHVEGVRAHYRVPAGALRAVLRL